MLLCRFLRSSVTYFVEVQLQHFILPLACLTALTFSSGKLTVSCLSLESTVLLCPVKKNVSSVKVMPGYLLFTEFMGSIISALSVIIFILHAACQGHGCSHSQLLFKCLTLPWLHRKTYWIKGEWLAKDTRTKGKSYRNHSDYKQSESILDKAYGSVWILQAKGIETQSPCSG